ncbi:TCR/Tet family MFS transporter [Bdellovibrio sp. SKB1291214]|uniref:TCR/Tet family MFS transporter n=1 Tax=Bdellovibrio sp. SKB1291214 TaxID=1732569 RepID=UPI000B515E84|nr:TCR/Tet family MFS transporter [Bdellovibrio sp. SKB1291214]UYL09133.1 TCR/Tet family MFS transporter [Bdellovibrio sp. SKB1291214]
MKQKSSSASVRFIFATIFLDALGIGVLIPVFPDVIRRFGHDPSFVNHYYGYFISIYALMQFLASPVLGSLSDRFGRRPVLLVSLLGAGLDYLLMAFAPTLGILFAGRIVSGLTGASMTVASSYMADISDDSNRSANFGMIGAAFGLGFIVGPGLGGILGHYGHQAPFIAAAVFNLLNFAFGYFILPESLDEAHRRKMSWGKLNPFASLMRILFKPGMRVMVWIYFLLYLSGQSHPSIWTLYTQYKFNWSTFEVGLSLSFVGLSVAFVQGYLTRLIVPKWGEMKALNIGIFFSVSAYFGYAFATHGWMLYAVLALTCLNGVTGPASMSLISKDTPPQEQGELQGSLISIASLTSILGPLIYTDVFAKFTSEQASVQFPGSAYFLAGLFSVVSWILFILYPRFHKTGHTTGGPINSVPPIH